MMQLASKRTGMPSLAQIAQTWGRAVACFKCGGQGSERAHVVPVRDGGTSSAENLFVLCGPCHAAQPDHLPYEQQIAWLLGRIDARPLTKSTVTRAALAKARERGVQLGGTPFGARRDSTVRGSFVVADDEATVVAQLVALRESGETWRGVASRLNAAGVKSKRGGMWHAMAAMRIYNRARGQQ